VARKLLFILITVEDELSAYTVFETLNARGLELSSTDLLKNYLFSRVKARADLTSLQRRWKALVAVVRQERFPDFLRYHLLCDAPQVRKQRLFKLVQSQVSSAAQVFALMEALESRAELFAALNDAEHEYWLGDREAKRHVRELLLFRVRQTTPLLFAAYECLSAADFVRVLKLVSVVSFRYIVVGGLNTNELEPAYRRAAKALLTKQASKPADVFSLLRGIYVDDSAFLRGFERLEIETSGQRKRLVKYVLCQLESDASGVQRDYEADPASIEHILPENPLESWSDCFDLERHDRFVYRLGNLTLLEPSLNRQVGNQAWSEKVLSYATSGYQMTQTLAAGGYAEWTSAALDLRQSQMAQRAVHIWRADFS